MYKRERERKLPQSGQQSERPVMQATTTERHTQFFLWRIPPFHSEGATGAGTLEDASRAVWSMLFQ